MSDNEKAMISSAYRDRVTHVCENMRAEINRIDDSKLVDSDSTHYRRSLIHRAHSLLNNIESALKILADKDGR